MSTEFVRDHVLRWTPDTAKIYQCPVCLRPVFTTYEGDEVPTIVHEDGGHRVTWPDEPTKGRNPMPEPDPELG
jgi:hypothetical protein